VAEAAAAQPGDRLTDPDLAGRVASTERKDLFLLFTGTAWCGACIKFEAQVLSQPEFIAGTSDFVRVKLEFPGSEDQFPPDRRERDIACRDLHGIRAYPTVILSDPDGRPYALTGFDDELHPDPFIRKPDKLRPVRDRRDAALNRADRSQGMEKARALDEALTAIRGASDPSLVDIEGELVVRFDRAQIEEVIALDPDNAAGLRDRYRALLATDDEQTRLNQLNNRLTQVVKEQGVEAALALFDAEMARVPSSEFRSKLIISKLYLLESAKKFEEARALAEELAADLNRPLTERNGLRLRSAYDLLQLDRVAEASVIYNDLIAQAVGDLHRVIYLYSIKATACSIQAPEEAIKAWEKARSLAPAGSQDWLDAEVPRLRTLRRMGRLEDSLRGFDDVLAIPSLPELERTVCRADKALTLSKLGRRDDALTLAAEVEAALSRFDQPENASTTQFIRSMLEAARRGSVPSKP